MVDMLLDLISQLIDLRLLVLTIIVGYLIFFIYFYKTEYWSDFGWPERSFFAFIIGFITVFVCINWIPSIISSWFEIMRGYYIPSTAEILFMVPGSILLIIGLVVFRQEIGKPLQDSKAHELWINLFKSLKFKYLIAFYIFLAFFLFWIPLNYPFSEFLVLKWMDFFCSLCFGVFFLYVILPTFLSTLTYLLKWKFYAIFDFWEDIKKIRYRSVVKISAHLLILLLLTFLIASVDSQLGILTPKVTMKESVDIIDNTLYFWRYSDNSTTVLSSNSLTMHILSPLVQSISINELKIRNPSNYTTSSNYYKNKISSSDGLDCTFSSDEQTIDVKINYMEREDQYFTINYYCNLNVNSLVSFEEEKFLPIVEFDNGTNLKEYVFEFSNLSPYNIELEAVYLLYQLHDISSYNSTVTFSDNSGCYCVVKNSSGNFYLEGTVKSETSFKVSLQIFFTYWG